MTAAHKIGHAAGTSQFILKEIFLSLAVAIAAGGLWKKYQWDDQRRTKEFYNMLEKGHISIEVEE